MKVNAKNNINDIARAAGVSISTVSRVFNRRPYVKDNVRQKVMEAANSLEYSPKVTARRDTVAIVAAELKNMQIGSYDSAIIAAIVGNALANGLKTEIVSLHDIDLVFENFVQAVIGITYDKESVEKLRVIKNAPVLMINNVVPDFPYVCTDHKGGLKTATQYLIEHGHSRIGLYLASAPGPTWGTNQRLDGYKEALENAGIPFLKELIGISLPKVFEEMARICLVHNPTAFIICGEGLAMPAWYTLQLLKKRVPEDISLILFDSPGVTPYLLPRPTILKQDFDQLGKVAVEKIKQIIAGTHTGRVEVILPTEFIEGETVRQLKK
ncbi:MAG: LacI family DNA-binding transcriptional regulator [Victivallaceae bacterium]|jgi:DNA-binding LacI/PurR family transcriptional regulator